ncbi:CD3337/EF1877 family mobilome membrane protein [Anaerocolumna aminovalerica]|uniref:CD3337/EF1877 family mobilome membrane protein n=1 Tax=Anaerocolumna aminovalerica TaxID=1527 RepID=UPI003A7F5640
MNQLVTGSEKRKWSWQRTKKVVMTVFLILGIALFLVSALGTVAYAAGLVDDTVKAGNEYSRYPLNNYQLDFYVDNGWDWLPWNWLDGIGKQVMYGLYAITNFIWTISLYLSNATGYLVQEAYSLDFISDTADSIGKNIQTIAGVSTSGLSPDGFYSGFLLILILIVGIYVAYTGLIKRETTKAIHAVINFVVVFVLSAAFIAYAPDYIGKINDFSSDISNASLSLGTKIVMPDSESKGKDSVDLIRDSLFSIQVKQPWLLLQFDNSDSAAIGEERIESLLSTSPNANSGKDREELVKEEIEDKDNTNLTITKTINRLGMVFFLFLFNIGISVFVFLLTGILIFSQVLFIIYAMFLPISFLLSMIPTFEGMSRRAITKLFNTILTRAGITLIITTAFSISTMLYTLSTGYPFFLVAFLQIVTFAGIYFKLGDLMSMFSLQSGDSQSVGRQIMRKPRMLMQAHMHRLQHKLGRSVAAMGKSQYTTKKTGTGAGTSRTTQADHTRPDKEAASRPEQSSFGKHAGEVAGKVMDTKDRIRDTVGQLKKQAKDMPVNTRYALYHGRMQVSEGIQDFTSGVTQTRAFRQEERENKAKKRRNTIAQRRSEMERASQRTASHSFDSGKAPKAGGLVHERPTTAPTRQSRPIADSPTQATRPTVQPETARTTTQRPVVSAKGEQQRLAKVPDHQADRTERQAERQGSSERQSTQRAASSGQRERTFPVERQVQSIGSTAPVEKRVLRQSTQKRRFTVKREPKIKGSTIPPTSRKEESKP